MQAIRSSLSASSRRTVIAASAAAPRSAAFSTSLRWSKDPVQSVKETADTVNKTVGEGILKGVIEPAEKASEAVKSATGMASKKAANATEDLKGIAKDASYEAEKVKADAGQQINHAATQAKKAAK